MRIAYLISVYKDPIHLRRLVKALSWGMSGKVRFFIHVDAKVSIEPFEQCFNNTDNIVFPKQTVLGAMGGYSQVQYQIELFNSAIRDEQTYGKYDRFVLITGQDYPLMSNADMVRMYETEKDKLFIRGLNKTLHHKKAYWQFTKYHFFRDTRFRNPRVKQLLSFTSRLLFTILPIRKPPYLICDDGTKWDVWQASSYMSLTHQCVEYICSHMEQNKNISKYFRYSFVPEEKVVPTIIFNSSFKQYAEVSNFKEYRGLIFLSCLEEFEYGKSIKIYTEEDYDSLVQSGKLFCRKVETKISDKLMDMLDVHNGITDNNN